MEKAYFSLSIIALLFSPLQAANVPGTLDTSFNFTGTATVAVGLESNAYGVAIQQDGTIVLAGIGRDDMLPPSIALARLATDGSLLGTTTASFVPDGDAAGAYGIALQQNGKIVVAGQAPEHAFGVARFKADGSLDDTFNTIGTATTRIGSEDNESRGFSVAIQADGKIVVAGHVFSEGESLFGVARYLPTGSLDPSFGVGSGTSIPGTVVVAGAYTISSDGVTKVAVQQDGKIVLSGMGSGDDDGSIIVVRLAGNGGLDTTFGSGGVVKLPNMAFLADILPSGLAIQPDGKIVVSGNAGVEGQPHLAVARLNSNGSLDESFNETGYVTTTIDNLPVSSASSVVVQPNGKIVVVGLGADQEGGGWRCGVACFNPDGTLDTTFNPAGAHPGTASVAIGNLALATGVALQTDGKIVLGGRSSLSKDSDVKMAVARLFGDEGDVPPSGNSLFIQRLIEKYHSRV